MRKRRQIIVSILMTAALLGLAWYAGNGKKQVKMVGIIAANCDISAGSRLTASQLSVVQIPAQAQSGCFITDIDQAVGLWTSIDVKQGELISKHRLSHPSAGLQYPDAGSGRRLLTLKLDPADANGFWLAAGNRIDLYLLPKNRESIADIQVLENIRIMAVLNNGTSDNGVMNTSAAGSQLLCLDLNTEQAQLINSAREFFDIRLAVINEPAK